MRLSITIINLAKTFMKITIEVAILKHGQKQ